VLLAGLAVLCVFQGAWAQGSKATWAEDVPGGQDHPLIQRFDDSWLLAYQQLSYDATTFPGKMGLDDKNGLLAPVAVEGRITRLLYVAPLGKTPVEVFRNYEQALAGAGFKAVVSCTPKVAGCDQIRFGFHDRYNELKQADYRAAQARHPARSPLNENLFRTGQGANMMGTGDIYFTYGTLTRNGVTAHLMLHTGKAYSTEFAGTYIEIAEPKAMPTGQVTVNADALRNGLAADGKIALYGIYFDTGKAEVKPESRAQLDEVAKLLKAQPALKVFLVGHTDNQGQLDANLTLSQKRAQAVADALLERHPGIDRERIELVGRGWEEPVSPDSELNRRVEVQWFTLE